MRVRAIALAAFCCVVFLAGCAGTSATQFTARPGERFTMHRTATSTGSLSDLASQVTTDTLLRNRGAKLLKAQPFAPCPGEAGEQTFTLSGPQGAQVLRVGFTQWNGRTTVVSYRRPARAGDDPQALEAMRRSLCSAVL